MHKSENKTYFLLMSGQLMCHKLILFIECMAAFCGMLFQRIFIVALDRSSIQQIHKKKTVRQSQ